MIDNGMAIDYRLQPSAPRVAITLWLKRLLLGTEHL
jgi:hypothetical protein